MRKVLLIITAVAVFGLTKTQAQEEGMKIGFNAAMPVGDAGSISSFGVALDFGFVFNVTQSFQLGGVSGYQHFFGKTDSYAGTAFDYEDSQFIPVAVAARFFASDLVFLGADLGYAFGLNDRNEGGFYYRPKVGYFLDSTAIVLSYTGVSIAEKSESFGGVTFTRGGNTFSSFQLGVEFGF